ncbi:MAG: recombinase family protein [Pseudomonadota bacterium]
MNVWPKISGEGRRIGYARVSTKDQNLRMQRDALSAIDCHRLFEDHGVSGAKGKRPGLDAMLRELRPGDTVVVFKLDRLGRSVQHLSDLLVKFHREGIHFCSLSEGINTTTPGGKLIFHVFAAVAEFHRDIIVENTVEGLEAARRQGAKLGRPKLLDAEAILLAHQKITQEGVPVGEAAKRLGVSESTMRRAIKRLDLEAA